MARSLNLVFQAPGEVAVVEEELPPILPGQVLIQTQLSAISPGTEKLIYRGQAPKAMSLDASLPSLPGAFRYPFRYGYALVGQVVELGDGVASSWLGARVFGFLPHQSFAVSDVEGLRVLPEGASPDDYVFLPNMESAVNFVMDARPVIGERVLVLGQGVLGLLTTALLARFPLGTVVTVDLHEQRRAASLAFGADASVDASTQQLGEQLVQEMGGPADLVFELSGFPEVLNHAIQVAGIESRIVVGSWFGERQAKLDLGGKFHRNRLRLISSQVSTIGSRFSGRWDKSRRLGVVESLLGEIAPQRLITHRVPIADAAESYRLLDEQPERYIQIVLTYD